MTDYGLLPLLHATIVSPESSKQILSWGWSPDSYLMYLVTLSYRIKYNKTCHTQNLVTTCPLQKTTFSEQKLMWK